MIYKDTLEHIELDKNSLFYTETKLMREYDDKISNIMGNHRDPDNEFAKN